MASGEAKMNVSFASVSEVSQSLKTNSIETEKGKANISGTDKLAIKAYVLDILKENGIDIPDNGQAPEEDTTSPAGAKDKKKKAKKKEWKISTYASSISARSVISSGVNIGEAYHSGDIIKLRQSAVSASASLAIVAASTFAGPYGFIVGNILSTVWSIFDTATMNTIQIKGDKKRTAFKFDNWDYGKYGTYVYNNETKEWNAKDVGKITSRLMLNRKSV